MSQNTRELSERSVSDKRVKTGKNKGVTTKRPFMKNLFFQLGFSRRFKKHLYSGTSI